MDNLTSEEFEKHIQERIIADLGSKPSVDPKVEIGERVQFLKDFLTRTGLKGFVLGISGGQDSSLAGRLAQLAVEELRRERGENAATFVAMRLPYGVQKDEEDAQLALDFINPDHELTFNIKAPVDAFKEEYDFMVNGELSDFTKGNTKARMRMLAQYAYAGENGLLVIGTDHAAEAVTGFFTKFGDGAADVLPLSGLTKRQGKALLKELNAPERLYLKAPTADLLDRNAGREDEDELGLTYDELDDYLEGREVTSRVHRLVADRYFKTMHKRQEPVSPHGDRWWA